MGHSGFTGSPTNLIAYALLLVTAVGLLVRGLRDEVLSARPQLTCGTVTARMAAGKAREEDVLTTGAIFSPRLLLRGVATVAATAAVAADTRTGEHPTHSLVLLVVATVITLLRRRLAPGSAMALPAVSIAIAAQPALHLITKIGQPVAAPHHHGSVLHIVASEAPPAGMQIVVPALGLVAATIGLHLLHLLIDAVRRPLTSTPAPLALRASASSPVRPARLGSMLRWCGWVIRAARRGPPAKYRAVLF